MSEFILWEYAGIEFKVSSDLTPDQRDGVCSVLLSEYDHRRGSVSDYSVSPQNNNLSEVGVIPPESHEDRLEAFSDGLEEVVATLNECRVCGKSIMPTGRRGRPRKIHEECR